MKTNINKLSAISDLLLIGLVFWGVWSLRFAGVQFIGALTMGAGILTVVILMRWRKQSLATLGIREIQSARWLISRSAQAAAYIGLTMLIAGGLAGALLGGPEESAAVTQQPKGFWLFLLDVTLVTWVLVGFGEEFVFRGFILNRLLCLTGETRNGIVLSSVLQAIWFGAGHASQGLTGMLITGAIGFVLALVFLTRLNRILWPLVIAHAGIDTVVLTLNWFSSQ
jgi:membrane protease YdiL (CAAX protease family)